MDLSAEDLSIHFFTIVLNGEPFIRYHYPVLENLPFRWHWHIVEGAAELRHDTAWSCAFGGKLSRQFHRNGLSNDGTSEYLDRLKEYDPCCVSVYRPSPGTLWDGKLAMINAPIAAIGEHCLLWQLDVDEFWTTDQIVRARELFLAQPEKTAAWYYCHFYITPQLIIVDNPDSSHRLNANWLRTWRYRPGCRWQAHEPPKLHDQFDRNLGLVMPFLSEETRQAGLVFQHKAYVLPSQLEFKEVYYGYQGITANWQRLQQEQNYPVRLKPYFPWPFIGDDTEATLDELAGISSIPLPVVSGMRYASSTHRTTIMVACADYRKEMTQNCLSLIKQHTANYELMIIDNASDPDFSYPATMNRAIRAAGTDFLVLMDDDVYVEPGWLDGLLACIDEQTAVVVPLHQGKAHFSGVYMADDGELLHIDPAEIADQPWPVQRYSSALMLLDLRKIGSIRMQEQYRKFYFDCVHAFEVWEAGYRAVCTPHVSITHLCGATINSKSNNALAVVEHDWQLFRREWVDSGRIARLEQNVWHHDPCLGAYVETIALARQMRELGPELLLGQLHSFAENSPDRRRFEKVVQQVAIADSNAVTGTGETDRIRLFVDGRLLYELGAWLPSLFCFRRALELKPDDAETWEWIGRTAEKVGDMKLAAMAHEGARALEGY